MAVGSALTSLQPIMHLPRWQIGIMAAMLFLIAGTNGTPMWWSSAVPSLIFTLILILARGPQTVLNATFSRRNRSISWLLIAMLIVTALSTLVHPAAQSLQGLLFRTGIPLLVYLAFVGAPIRRSDFTSLLLAIALGSTIPMGLGALAFYQEWGIPDLLTLLWARYDLVRMSGYTALTFGNVNHVGPYITLLVPGTLMSLLYFQRRLRTRIPFLIALGLLLVNLIISGARSGFIVFLFSCLVIVLVRYRKSKWFFPTTMVALGVLLVSFSSLNLAPDDSVINRFVPQFGAQGVDNSLVERWESIAIGQQVFLENWLLGVGPGLSPEHNIHAIPHQSVVHVLSELGLLGGVIFILLNGIVFLRTAFSAWGVGDREEAAIQFTCLMGPACWFLNGLIAGFSFHMGLALLWSGLAYAYLGLAGARIVPEDHRLSRIPALWRTV